MKSSSFDFPAFSKMLRLENLVKFEKMLSAFFHSSKFSFAYFQLERERQTARGAKSHLLLEIYCKFSRPVSNVPLGIAYPGEPPPPLPLFLSRVPCTVREWQGASEVSLSR